MNDNLESDSRIKERIEAYFKTEESLVMSLYAAGGLFAAMLILAVSPGPGVFATVSRALFSGFRPALAVVAGIVLGDVIFLYFAAFGLNLLARTMHDLFLIIRIAGGGYLIFLGIKIWFAKPTTFHTRDNGRRKSSLAGNFLSGLLITLSNPKVILFYCGFLPTFVDMTALTASDLCLITLIVGSVLGGVMSVYAYLAHRAATFFNGENRIRCLNRAAGGIMTAAGVAVISR